MSASRVRLIVVGQVEIGAPAEWLAYTLIRNKAHKDVNSMLGYARVRDR